MKQNYLSISVFVTCAVLFLGVFVTKEALAQAPVITTVYTHGSFETGGVIISLGTADGNESATLEIKGPSDSGYRRVQDFVAYDLNNMATSIFDLSPATTYDIRIVLTDPDATPTTASVTDTLTTRNTFSIPGPLRTLVVNQGEDIQAKIDTASSGDEIVVSPGTYQPFNVIGKIAQESAPIVIRASDINNKPIIDANNMDDGIYINDSAYVYISGFEIKNSDQRGVYVRSSKGIVVQNTYMHDNSQQGILNSKGTLYRGGPTEGGFHIFQDNVIENSKHGIQSDNNSGAGTVIRRNTITGGKDQIKSCGDESAARALNENTQQVLIQTGGNWSNRDTEVYDNILDGASDDNIETDGLCVNLKVYRNTLMNAINPFSIAPIMPGPVYILRNEISGDWGEAGIKMNTGSSYNHPTRNVFIYHNTFKRDTFGPILNLWYAKTGDHNVPVKNIHFRNNIFSAPAGGRATDVSINVPNAENPSFDYNVWYSTTTEAVFEWWVTQKDQYDTFGEFQSATGQESNGKFANPLLNNDLTLQAGSPAIDSGVLIAGINDNYSGNGPDAGANESGLSATPTPTPTPTAEPTATPLPTPTPAPTPTPEPGSRPHPSDYGLNEGDVVSTLVHDNDFDIYIINDFGYKRLFVSPEIFELYGHIGYDKVRSITPPVRDAFETSGIFRNCEADSQEVWALEVLSEDVAVLHYIAMTGPEAVAEDPDFFNKVFCINNLEENLYPKSTVDYTSLSQIPDYSR